MSKRRKKSKVQIIPQENYHSAFIDYVSEDRVRNASDLPEVTDYYSYDYLDSLRVDGKPCQYKIVIGERQNGKSYAMLKRILTRYLETGDQGAIIRRRVEDFRGRRSRNMWEDMIRDVLPDTEWDNIIPKSGAWYLAKWDDDLGKNVLDAQPFCYYFSLVQAESDKSTSYPGVKTIFFDEFMSRQAYLVDEFVILMNVISTIKRNRSDVSIYMAGNTVDLHCPYIKEFGFKHIKEMQPGDVSIYRYGESGLSVALEYCPNYVADEKKEADVFFAFDNPKLQMITGGAWEMSLYPHLPVKYNAPDIVYKYFIIHDHEILQADVVNIENIAFTYIHRKTTPLKDPYSDLVFSAEPDPRPNWQRFLNRPPRKLSRLWKFFQEDRVYYQDNEIGELVRSYLRFCSQYCTIRA